MKDNMKETINIDGVEYTRTSDKFQSLQTELNAVKAILRELKSAFEVEEQNSEETYLTAKEEGLTFGSLESEGNLRGIRYMKSLFDYLTEDIELK